MVWPFIDTNAQCYLGIIKTISNFRILTGNTRYIKDLLDRFEDPRQVPNWVNQGSIILDYLDITAKVCVVDWNFCKTRPKIIHNSCYP